MKPMDILDALSDLPEEYAAFEVQKADLQGSSDTAQTAPAHKERIVMNHTARITQTPHRANIAGIAAAIALCVGLNAALIFGIARLKQDPNTQMPGSEPPVQEITTNAETVAVVTPDLIGKDWKTVKEKHKGLYLAKHYVEANDQPAETVIAQDPKPGDILPESGIVRCDVTMTSESYPLTMEFPVPPDLPYSDDTLLIVIKDVGGYIWGCSDEFSAKSGDIVSILADVPELDTPVTAWLWNATALVSYPIGEYTLHGPTCEAPGGETHPPYYSTFMESRDIGFHNVLKQDPNTQMPGSEPPVQEITTNAETVAVVTPNLVGMNWNTAKRKAKDCGILLSKQNVNASGQPAGTVVEQVPYANTELSSSRIVFCNVAIDPNAHDTEITFQLSKKQNGLYYIYLRDEQQNFLGCSMTFYMDDIGTNWGFTVECPEPDTKAEAVLVNAENRKEAVIGTYILHQSPAPYAEEWRTFTPFDVISEDVEAAFRQVQN